MVIYNTRECPFVSFVIYLIESINQTFFFFTYILYIKKTTCNEQPYYAI